MVEILLCLVSAVLGIQIAEESTLALWIKQSLYLTQPYSKRLEAIATLKFWWVLTGRFSILLLPFYLVFLFLLKTHQFLSNLLDCSRCTSTWIFGILLYALTPMTLLYSILYAPLAILAVYIIERIKQ